MVYCPTVFSSPSSASSLGDELQPRPLLRDSNANWCPNNRGFLPTGKDRKVTEKVQVWWTKVIVYIWNASFHHFGLINVYNKPGRVGITWVNLLRTLEAIQKNLIEEIRHLAPWSWTFLNYQTDGCRDLMDLDHAHPEITRMWRNLCWMLHSHWLKSPNSLSEPTLATSPEWVRMSALGRSSATPNSRPEKHAKKSTKRGFRVVGGHFLLSHIKIYKSTLYIHIYIYASFVKSLLDHPDNICRASSESASACQMYLNELVQNGMIWTGRPWLAKGPIWSYQVRSQVAVWRPWSIDLAVLFHESTFNIPPWPDLSIFLQTTSKKTYKHP